MAQRSSNNCAFIGPKFDSQHPHAGSQPSVIPVPADPMPYSGLCGFHIYMPCTCIHAGKLSYTEDKNKQTLKEGTSSDLTQP